MARKTKTPKVSKEAVKAAAERAEKRSKGETVEDKKIPVDPPILRLTAEDADAAEPAAHDKIHGSSRYDPSHDERAAELCSSGATDDQLAEEFGVSVRTVNRWKVAHPTFRHSIKDAKDIADDRVKRSLYHKALGIEYEEMQAIKLKRVTYEDGKRKLEEEYIEMVPVKKFMPPDTTASIFWMKNRQSHNWRDVHKHEHGEPGDFDTMDDDQLRQYIRTEQEVLIEPARIAKGKSSTKH